MSEKETKAFETEDVTVKVPKGIMQFLEDIIPSTTYDSVQHYLEDAIISRIEGDIDGDVFNPTLKRVVNRYKLEGVFDS
jgi:hypothetical protein